MRADLRTEKFAACSVSDTLETGGHPDVKPMLRIFGEFGLAPKSKIGIRAFSAAMVLFVDHRMWRKWALSASRFPDLEAANPGKSKAAETITRASADGATPNRRDR